MKSAEYLPDANDPTPKVVGSLEDARQLALARHEILGTDQSVTPFVRRDGTPVAGAWLVASLVT